MDGDGKNMRNSKQALNKRVELDWDSIRRHITALSAALEIADDTAPAVMERVLAHRAERLAEKYGAMKAVRLEVAGAFHTRLMYNAAETLQNALWQARIAPPGPIKTIVNITGEYYVSADGIIDGLTRQLVSPILWQKCMERLLADGVEQFYEIGPGRVLTGLMKRINRKAKVTNVSDLSSVKALTEGA